MFGALWAILRQRCPRCRKGQIFRGRFAMNDPCPVCGMIFQREEGYFLGAMYVSYLLGCACLIPSYLIASALFPTWSSFLVAVVAMLPYLAIMPMVFRYSRVIWIHFERSGDRSENNAGIYEKVRRREFEKEKLARTDTESDQAR